jgi:Tol biopolymer transport system component
MLRAAPLVAAIAIAPSAEATFAGSVGRIAFVEDSDIWLVNPDGAVKTRLTEDGGSSQPAFSPDSRRIAYRGPGIQVWVMNADGSGKTQLTEDPGGSEDPAFSPDGGQIAFTSGRNASGTRIWVMNADGSGETQLTTGAVNHGQPTFSPDGRHIVYSSIDAIRRMNADGSGDVALIQTGGRVADPSMSPDGNQIVFHSFVDNIFGEIYIADADGSGLTRLTNRPSGAQHPVFSPDGQKILFSGANDSGVSALFTMNTDGSDVAELTSAGLNANSSWGSLPAAAPSPVPGVSANVSARRGTVLVKQPSSGRFVRVSAETQIPIGSLLDTTKGTVELTTARGSSGLTQTGTFKGGVFKVGQKRGNQPLTTLSLRGASLRCGSGATAAGRRARSRRLLGNTRRGRFRTRGRNSTATVRGTKWLTKDTCAGTLTAVRQGVVVVRDLRKRRTRTLRKGQRYLARAPKRR